MDVRYVPTPQHIVERMLFLASIKPTDIVCDLGCGDGRFLITASKKYGVHSYGVDIDPVRVKESTLNVEKNNLAELVKVEQRNLFDVDLSEMDVVIVYLLPMINFRLLPQFDKMKFGSRIVSRDYEIKGILPDIEEKFDRKSNDGVRNIFLWKNPLKRL